MSPAPEVPPPYRVPGAASPDGTAFASPFPPGVAFFFHSPANGPAPSLLPAERALLQGRASARREADFALGRHCARRALALLGVPEAESLPLLRGEGRAPRWPEGVVGSISHSAGMAAAAAAWSTDYAGIGLDLERIGRVKARLSRRILRPAERAALEALPPAGQAEALAVVFSGKESIYKALNPATGIYLGFQDAELEPLPSFEQAEGPLRWRLVRDCGTVFPAGFTGDGAFQCRGGFVLAGVWVPAGAAR